MRVERLRELLAGAGARRAALWGVPCVVAVVLAVALVPGVAGLRWLDAGPGLDRALEAGRGLGDLPDSFSPSDVDPAPSEFESDPLEDSDLWSDDLFGSPDLDVADETHEDESESLDCIIEPFEMVELGSPVEGVIDEIAVERGDNVEVDQVVAVLESSVETAAVEVARARAEATGRVESREARLALDQKRKKRAQQLFASNALSLDQRQQVDTEARLARLEVREARESQRMAALELEQAIQALKRRTILSPIAGVVVDRLMSPGEVVDDDTIVRLAQIDPLRVEVILPSALFGTIEPGARVAIEPEFPGARVHVAEVKIVDPLVDGASGTFGVQMELPNPDHSIPGGLHCKVRFLQE